MTYYLLKLDVTKQDLLVVIGNIFSNHGHSLDSCSLARLGFPKERERGGGSDGNHEAIPRAATEATFGVESGPKAWPLHALGEWRGLAHTCPSCLLAARHERERAFFFLTSHEQGRVSCHLVVARPPSVRAFLYLNARIRQCWYPSVVGGASLRQSRMAATAAASIQLVRQDRPFSLVVKVEGPKATVVRD